MFSLSPFPVFFYKLVASFVFFKFGAKDQQFVFSRNLLQYCFMFAISFHDKLRMDFASCQIRQFRVKP
jgi:hypothetical protein